jgi:putative transposase
MKRSFIMPRRARLAMAGIAWHVIQRGNNRCACFYAEEDYRFYLQTLKEQADKHGCVVHAYVLMTNHVHLLMTPARVDGVALTMKHVGQRYTQYVNRAYRRSGTLWEGRFKSCLAQDERYVLACYRYIELNPVRANMVDHPGNYFWSSHRANALGECDALLTEHEQFRLLGCDRAVRRENYRALFAVHMDTQLAEEISKATSGSYVLGGSRFEQEIETALGRRVRQGKPGRPRRLVD